MSQMELSEFEKRFDALWGQKYSLYDPSTDHWSGQRKDDRAKRQIRGLLMDYARSIQEVGLARRDKNKAQRLFDELGIDPASLKLGALEGGSASATQARTSDSARGDIKYVERKAGKLTGEARIGRVTFSKSGKTLHYGGRSFRSLDGQGFKANYYCVETGEEYWISGCRRDGLDRLYGERVPVHIDDDVREEYWIDIRRKPEWTDRRNA